MKQQTINNVLTTVIFLSYGSKSTFVTAYCQPRAQPKLTRGCSAFRTPCVFLTTTATVPKPTRTPLPHTNIKYGFTDIEQVHIIGSRSCSLHMKSDEDDSTGDDRRSLEVLSYAGLIAQPVVWVSLYFVSTTGAGLPAGPFGLVGALEGISYLVVLLFLGKSIAQKMTSSEDTADGTSLAERLSFVSLVAGLGFLLVLASLVVQQGCVPNAKPILDYSGYLPVCTTTPGLFGE